MDPCSHKTHALFGFICFNCLLVRAPTLFLEDFDTRLPSFNLRGNLGKTVEISGVRGSGAFFSGMDRLQCILSCCCSFSWFSNAMSEWCQQAPGPGHERIHYTYILCIDLFTYNIYIYILCIYMWHPKKNNVHLTFAGICNMLCLFLVAFWSLVFLVYHIYIYLCT